MGKITLKVVGEECAYCNKKAEFVHVRFGFLGLYKMVFCCRDHAKEIDKWRESQV